MIGFLINFSHYLLLLSFYLLHLMFYFFYMVKRANRDYLNDIILRKEAVNAGFRMLLLRKMLEENRIIAKSSASLIIVHYQLSQSIPHIYEIKHSDEEIGQSSYLFLFREVHIYACQINEVSSALNLFFKMWNMFWYFLDTESVIAIDCA